MIDKQEWFKEIERLQEEHFIEERIIKELESYYYRKEMPEILKKLKEFKKKSLDLEFQKGT